jgi:DNA-binding IclR family transcriptional regulator
LNAALERGLERYTSRTCTDRRRFVAELETIRERGYAVNRGEWRSEVGGVAAPLRDHDGSVIAALGACGPVDDFSEKKSAYIVERVVAVAAEISVQLGWRPIQDEPAANGARTARKHS